MFKYYEDRRNVGYSIYVVLSCLGYICYAWPTADARAGDGCVKSSCFKTGMSPVPTVISMESKGKAFGCLRDSLSIASWLSLSHTDYNELTILTAGNARETSSDAIRFTSVSRHFLCNVCTQHASTF